MTHLKVPTVIAAATVAMALSATASGARDLTVISWGGAYQDAQRDAFFQPYQELTGQTLIDEPYNGELAKIKAMVEVGDVTWDVVQMEAPELENACDEGLLEPIDWSRIGGQDSVIPDAVMGDCGVGTIVWSVIIAYDEDRLGSDGPQNWADFWNVEQWPGKRSLRKTAKLTLEAALMADGVPADEVYQVLATEEGVDRAFAKLDEIKDHIQWFESGAQPPQWLASGDVVVTAAYNGRIASAVEEGRNFASVWDGQLYALDGWAIVNGSPNVDAAYDFIKLATEPENQANLSNKIPYGPTHVDAIPATDEAVQSQLPTNPDNLQNALPIDTLFWIENVEQLNQRFNNWASQ
ncbi:ABC transporter substrate-binding protein [Ruegeria sp. 2012CJ41-6]|uniref:ABC transporter substrate-binding protein n=1 Tax=Ruegeria spongiae TaxID=2942209 RepID=A0ABT0Q5I3_9RHOB|nr:ABC transporter substrate-binding protein [Ruegeria spongiae]MCL6284164.1 ABC transporter substrate-binding protein [Ruegeria spongiae]